MKYATILAALACVGCLSLSACQGSVGDGTDREVPFVELNPSQQADYDAAWADVNALDYGADPAGVTAALDDLETVASGIYPDGHPEFQRIALERVGPLFSAGKLSEAEALLIKARAELDGADGYESDWVSATNDLAVIYNTQGRHAEAAPLFADSLAYRVENTTGFPDQELGIAYNNKAASDFEFADFENALNNNAEALKIADALEPPYPQTALWYANRPVYLREAGRTEEALIAAREAAVNVARVLPENHPYNANMLNNLGALSLEAGRLSEAEAAARRAINIVSATTEEGNVQAAAMQVGLGNVKLAQGDYGTAQALYASALESFAAGGAATSNLAFSTRMRMNQTDFVAGRSGLAIKAQTDLVDDMAAGLPADSVELNRARLRLSTMQARSGDAALALDLAETALKGFSKRLPDDAERLNALSVTALAKARLGQAEAAGRAQDVLNAVSARRQLDSLSKASTAGQSSTIEEALGHVLLAGLESGDDALSFAAMQLLGDDGTALAQRKARQRRTLSGTAAAKYADLQDRVETLDAKRNAYLMGLGKGQADPDLYAEIGSLRVEVEAALADAEDIALASVDLATFQESLNEGDLVLFGRASGSEYRIIALSRDALVTESVPADRLRSSVETLRAELDRGLTDPSQPFDRAAAEDIYSLIARGELKQSLVRATHFKVKMGGVMDQIPLSVLHDGKAYLAGRASFSMLTDLSRPVGTVGAAMADRPRYVGVSYSPPARDEAKSSANPMLAYRSALGLQTGLSPLRNAAAEIARIGESLASHPVLFSDAAATEAAMRSDSLREADLIVFASHGLTAEASPMGEPALLLHADEADDGYLSASEISRLALRARLVVLSACDTAGAQQAGGQAYSGLTRAFFLSGADSVMVSHWPVRDDAAAWLTTKTVKGMVAGLSGPDALSAAMRELKRSDLPNADHPSIWGAFVIVGQSD